jgi:hypothetical protein
MFGTCAAFNPGHCGYEIENNGSFLPVFLASFSPDVGVLVVLLAEAISQ